ncbi:MAG TPA: carboxypeptidase regulatory-like domain-containing protein [Pseudonocardiaceae bacterium]
MSVLVLVIGLLGLPAVAAAQAEGIGGVITNVRDGLPISGAEVTAYTPAGEWMGYGYTDSTGAYDIPWLEPGDYKLHVTAYEFLEQWAFGRPDFASADVVTAPGTASMALTPTVEYGAVAGRLTTEAGHPVASSAVTLYTAGENWVESTATDADGRYRFDRVRAGDYKLRFASYGHSTQWAHDATTFGEAATFTVAANAVTTVDETTLPSGDVRISVVDGMSGAPVANACVNADMGLSFPLFACTGADGTVTHRNVLTGTYRFTVSPPTGYLYGSMDNVVVTAGALTEATVELTPESVIDVVIRDRAGTPVAGACVVPVSEASGGIVEHTYRCSGADGRVRFVQWPQDRYRLFVYTQDGSLGAQWVGPDGGTGNLEHAAWVETAPGVVNDVAVRLDPAGSIGGLVTSAVTGQPVSGVCPSVTPVAAWYLEPINTLCTGADGRYTIRGLGPYNWRVQFPDRSGAHAWVWSGGAAHRLAADAVRVTRAGTATADAVLPAAGTVAGQVVGATLPVQYITVTAVNERTGDYAGPLGLVRSGARYELTALATQRVRIAYAATPAGFVEYPEPVRAVAGTTRTLDLHVPSAAAAPATPIGARQPV